MSLGHGPQNQITPCATADVLGWPGTSGDRRDLGELDAAARTKEARGWFSKCASLDIDGLTDAEERS